MVIVSNIVYEVNNFIKNDPTLLAISGKSSIEPEPMQGYETDSSPAILYWWSPGIKSPELYFIHLDTIKYMILDTDAVRCFAMGNRIIEMLNQADNIQLVPIFSYFTPKWSILAKAESGAPTEREGFYSFILSIDIGYVTV